MENNKMNKANRDHFLDVIKGICIFFVIYVHLPKEFHFIPYNGVFHITGFFFVRGIILNNQIKSTDLADKLKRNIKSVIFIYFKISLFILLIVFILALFQIIPTSKIIVYAYKILSFQGLGTLWFIPCYCIGELFLLLFIKCDSAYLKRPLIRIGYIILIVIIMYIAKSFINNSLLILIISLLGEGLVACLFMLIGFLFGKYEKKVRKDLASNNMKLLFCFILSIFINVLIFKLDFGDLHGFNINFYYLLASIFGIIWLYLTSLIVNKNFIMNILFVWLGKNSLIIMITHYDLRLLSISLFLYQFIISYIPIKSSSVGFFIIFLFLLALEYCCVNLINKTKLKIFFN